MMIWEQGNRYHKGREVVRSFTERGIGFELQRGHNGFDAVSHAMDDAGEFIPIDAATLDEIRTHRDSILAYLRFWDRATDKVTRIWLQHDPEYRVEYS